MTAWWWSEWDGWADRTLACSCALCIPLSDTFLLFVVQHIHMRSLFWWPTSRFFIIQADCRILLCTPSGQFWSTWICSILAHNPCSQYSNLLVPICIIWWQTKELKGSQLASLLCMVHWLGTWGRKLKKVSKYIHTLFTPLLHLWLLVVWSYTFIPTLIPFLLSLFPVPHFHHPLLLLDSFLFIQLSFSLRDVW